MTRILALASAALIAASATATVARADMASMMSGYAACNTQYNQCVTSGTDMTIASTPAEGLAKIQANSANGVSCGQALQACYASVK